MQKRIQAHCFAGWHQQGHLARKTLHQNSHVKLLRGELANPGLPGNMAINAVCGC